MQCHLTSSTMSTRTTRPKSRITSPDFATAKPFHREKRTHAASAISPDDLLRFLDEITSGPGTAPPPASPVSPLVHNLTGISSPSLSVPVHVASPPLFPPASSSLDMTAPNGLGFNPSPFSLSPSFSKDQVAPQHLTTSFALASKPFDAGDILLPFDLEPSTAASLDILAFPMFDPTASDAAFSSAAGPFDPSTSSTAAVHPLALDKALDSPLGLASSLASPLSEFLSSPMFSVAGESSVPSATMSELPLPSPYEPALANPGATATDDGGPLPWFPPLPTSASLLYGTPLDAPAPTTTILRPLPPAPFAPPLPTSGATAVTPTAAAAGASKKRPAPTGFRPGAPALLPLDAPIQTRHSVIPSVTSKKRRTSAAEKALAKRGVTPAPVPAAPVGGADGASAAGDAAAAAAAADDHDGDADELPADIVAAVERKRLQNTLSARKSRARKQARLHELEGENEALRRRVDELETLLGLVAAGR
ncbi:hypothetical protein JCM3770_002457 [Rhodotorula araucariae]